MIILKNAIMPNEFIDEILKYFENVLGSRDRTGSIFKIARDVFRGMFEKIIQ